MTKLTYQEQERRGRIGYTDVRNRRPCFNASQKCVAVVTPSEASTDITLLGFHVHLTLEPREEVVRLFESLTGLDAGLADVDRDALTHGSCGVGVKRRREVDTCAGGFAFLGIIGRVVT